MAPGDGFDIRLFTQHEQCDGGRQTGRVIRFVYKVYYSIDKGCMSQ